MMRVFLALLFLATMVPLATAQTDLPNEDKAVFCLDVQVNKILESKLAESLGEEMVQEITEGMDLPVPAENYVRIFGLMGAPNSMQEAMGSKEIPFNMMFEFQMVDAESAKELFEFMQLDPETSQEIDGVKYLSPPPFAPQNIIAGITNETTVVFGTKDFVLAGSRMDLFSEELKKSWGRHTVDLPLRASLEMVSKADLIAEAVTMGGEGAPPFMAPMLGLVDNFESLNLTLDLSGEELLALRGLGKSDTDAEELRGGLNGLLGMAKLGASGMQAELQKAPKAAAMLDGVMKDLNTSGEGREVNIIIGRPAEMEAGVTELLVMTRAAAKVTARQNNLRQVLLAIHNHDSAFNKMPFEADESKPSWRVAVKPFLFAGSDEGMSEVFGEDGENAMIAHVRTEKLVTGFGDVSDGTSNTICLVEVKKGIPWKTNKDVTPDQVVEMVKSLEDGEVIFAGFYDASVQTLTSDMDAEMIKAMCTPAGGEVVER